MAAWVVEEDFEPFSPDDGVDSAPPRSPPPAPPVWRDGERQQSVSRAAVECGAPRHEWHRTMVRPGVRCNNWLEPDGMADNGVTPPRRRANPPRPNGGGGGGGRPMNGALYGWNVLCPRPMTQETNATFTPEFPQTRQRSPAVSEFDEPLISPEQHGYVSGESQAQDPALLVRPGAAETCRSFVPSACGDHCSGITGASGTDKGTMSRLLRAVATPAGGRFVIRRNGKWDMTVHQIDHFGALNFVLHAKMTAFGLGHQQAWRFFETQLAMTGKPAPPDLAAGLPPLEPGALVYSVGHLTWAKEIGKTSFILSEMLPGDDGLEPVTVLQATRKRKKPIGPLQRRAKANSWKVRVHEPENVLPNNRRFFNEPRIVRSISGEGARFQMLSGQVAQQHQIPSGPPHNLIMDSGDSGDNHAVELGVAEENTVFELCVTQPFTPFQGIGLAVASVISR